MNNKLIAAVSTAATASLVAMYGYSNTEMSGTKPAASFSLDFSKESCFARFIV